MKNLVEQIFASVVLGVLALGQGAHGQRAEQVIKANIPFEFNVGGQSFPAGNYSLVRITPSLLQLRDIEGHPLTTVVTNSVQTLKKPASPKLEFYSEGGRHALARIWQENELIGQQLRPPKSWPTTAKQHPGRVQTAEAGTSR
jgi:hypothetical protein